MGTLRDQMLQAPDLIKQKRYAEARAILQTIEHPKAKEWLIRLDQVAPEKPKREPLTAAPVSPVLPPVQINIAQQTSSQPVIVVANSQSGPGCLVQFLWFIALGWWISQLAIWASYLLVISVFFLPFGFMLMNKVPYLATLKQPKQDVQVKQVGGATVVKMGEREQRPLLVRALYFLVIGWWLGFLTLELAWLLTATYLLAPLGLVVFGWAPAVISLKK